MCLWAPRWGGAGSDCPLPLVSSYTAHVSDHALITWLSCTEYVAEHALFTWLITHLSRDITCTDHVALMH